MERQKALEKLLSCVLCQEKFSKINKPLIMFCGHNICEECKLKHLKKITCTVCKKVFSKREIKKFQINYSILENKNISQTEEPSIKENDSNILPNISEEVASNFVSTVMNQVFKIVDANKIDNKTEVEKEQTKINEIIKERDLIVKETDDYIDNLEKNYYDYLNNFHTKIFKDLSLNSEILINDLNIAQLLEESGVINFGDMIKLGKLMELFEDIKPEDLMNCSSFEQIYSVIIDKNENINYEEFISLLFFFNKVYELKIKKLPKILEAQKKIYSNKKECQKNLIHFIFNFVQKYESNLSDMFYDITNINKLTI